MFPLASVVVASVVVADAADNNYFKIANSTLIINVFSVLEFVFPAVAAEAATGGQERRGGLLHLLQMMAGKEEERGRGNYIYYTTTINRTK